MELSRTANPADLTLCLDAARKKVFFLYYNIIFLENQIKFKQPQFCGIWSRSSDQTTVSKVHISGKRPGPAGAQTTTEKLHMGSAGGNSGQTVGLRPVDYTTSAHLSIGF